MNQFEFIDLPVSDLEKAHPFGASSREIIVIDGETAGEISLYKDRHGNNVYSAHLGVNSTPSGYTVGQGNTKTEAIQNALENLLNRAGAFVDSVKNLMSSAAGVEVMPHE
ncbi:hypothetical protein ACJJIE_02475 [Microbulbifer sp. TRSA001]|uniref:hypothetical protein n=1 Tax=Microbulbifer sp. TRSA001 TaxID=3243381 RepID=UPI00403A573E